MNWIKVEERLPEQDHPVLAYSKANKEFQVGYVIYCEDIKMPYVWTCTLVGECEEISHWMDLPKAPVAAT